MEGLKLLTVADLLAWPEDRTLVIYALEGDTYRILTTLTAPDDTAAPVRLPPFEAEAIDLGYILGA